MFPQACFSVKCCFSACPFRGYVEWKNFFGTLFKDKDGQEDQRSQKGGCFQGPCKSRCTWCNLSSVCHWACPWWHHLHCIPHWHCHNDLQQVCHRSTKSFIVLCGSGVRTVAGLWVRPPRMAGCFRCLQENNERTPERGLYNSGLWRPLLWYLVSYICLPSQMPPPDSTIGRVQWWYASFVSKI